MSDRFDFEQQIQKCWIVTDDVAEVAEGILEHDLDNDQIVNALMGIKQLYELKFNKLWDLFEDVHMSLVRENKMLNEECSALREQLGHGAGKNFDSGAGTGGFGIEAIKPKKKDKK